MKTAIIALSIVLASISAAHAGSVVAFHCPKSGDVILDTGNGDNELTITHGSKHFTVTEPTERKVVNGKILTIQGAANANDESEWRAVGIPNDWERTGKLYLIRSDRKGFEDCMTTDAQSY
ncbi:hypothetical protein F7430_22745 [Salmonella enterica]|nr:hypothetical protein [Salmonella enterica]EFF4796156.1 hypothetical protein [Escherichia coli]